MRFPSESTDVNDYLREAAGANFTAKDFRTWHGTVQALELTRLVCDTPRHGKEAARAARTGAKEILATVARQLGNTPAICKKAYIHPAVLALGGALARDVDAMQEIWSKIAGQAKARRRLNPAETRLLAFLREQKGCAPSALQRRRHDSVALATEKRLLSGVDLRIGLLFDRVINASVSVQSYHLA